MMRWLHTDYPELAKLTPAEQLDLAGLLVSSARLELNFDVNEGIGSPVGGDFGATGIRVEVPDNEQQLAG
jgi:hypothetical protein